MEFSRQGGLSFPTPEDLPNPSVWGVCNFLGSVSPQQKFKVKDGPSVQFYLASSGKYILEAQGQADPKDTKRDPSSILAPLFMCFSPPSEPALCKLG